MAFEIGMTWKLDHPLLRITGMKERKRGRRPAQQGVAWDNINNTSDGYDAQLLERVNIFLAWLHG